MSALTRFLIKPTFFFPEVAEGTQPSELREAEVPIVDRETCTKNLSAAGLAETIICAGGRKVDFSHL